MTDFFKLKQAPSGSPKKWQVKVPTPNGRGRTVSFGARGYEDYTQHKDKNRRANYRSRHRNDNLDDPYSAGFWSWHVLWGDTADRNKAFASAVRKAKKLIPKSNPSRAPAAGFLFVSRQGRFLLLRRSQGDSTPGLWSIPGGGSKPGESAEETAVRETEEEIGFLPVCRLIDRVDMQGDRGFCYTTFIAEVSAEFEPILNEEHDAYGWFDEEDLELLALHPGLAILLNETVF